MFARLVGARGHEARAPLRDRLRRLGAGSLEALVGGLRHPDPFARWEAVNLLGELALPASATLLVEYALSETEVHARWRSFWAVARLPRSVTVPMLLPELASNEWTRRWNAALMLSMLERCEASPVLLEGLRSPAAHTCWEAASAAGALRDRRLAAPVAKLLAPKSPPALRQEAALALGKIGGRRAASALARALDDREPGVRWRASMALAGCSADAGTILNKRLERETDSKVIDQLKNDLQRWEVRYGSSESRAGA